MRVATIETTIVSVPYLHREVSSQVARDGVTDILVRVETDDGAVGWGEACSGADAASVESAVKAMAPFVIGRDPWNREAMQADLFTHGLWQFRTGTGNFAWAGVDMALLDLCGRAAGQPLYRLLGGLHRNEVSYFSYLARGSDEELQAQCAQGVAQGYETFYLKVGIDPEADMRDGRHRARCPRAGAAAAARRERHVERAGRPSHTGPHGGARHRPGRAAGS